MLRAVSVLKIFVRCGWGGGGGAELSHFEYFFFSSRVCRHKADLVFIPKCLQQQYYIYDINSNHMEEHC